MIDHSSCDHPSTSGARAKCRRAQNGSAPKTKKMGATPRTPKEDDSYGQTPRDRHMECDKCGVEKIEMRGTEPLTGILIYVGSKCSYYLKHADDVVLLD